jgi:hypothetical protein
MARGSDYPILEIGGYAPQIPKDTAELVEQAYESCYSVVSYLKNPFQVNWENNTAFRVLQKGG